MDKIACSARTPAVFGWAVLQLMLLTEALLASSAPAIRSLGLKLGEFVSSASADWIVCAGPLQACRSDVSGRCKSPHCANGVCRCFPKQPGADYLARPSRLSFHQGDSLWLAFRLTTSPAFAGFRLSPYSLRSQFMQSAMLASFQRKAQEPRGGTQQSGLLSLNCYSLAPNFLTRGPRLVAGALSILRCICIASDLPMRSLCLSCGVSDCESP